MKMKLPKKVKGKELIKVVEDSMNSLKKYEHSTQPYLNNIHNLLAERLLEVSDHDNNAPNLPKKRIRAHKYNTEPVELTFKGKLKILYAFPIIGWLMYAKEKGCSRVTDTSITTDYLESNKDYNEIIFKIVKENHISGVPQSKYRENIDEKTLPQHPNIQKDFETLQRIVYEKLEV